MLEFYRNKRVLVTGHTGFKGTWLCKILINAGADVYGYSLDPVTEPNLFNLTGIEHFITSIIGDIRDLKSLQEVFARYKPEIVFHLAAQPIVRESYKEPVYTYETNVMGTVNILECVRLNESVKSIVNVTTDKVYKNREWEWGYRENEELNGFDPYSNSKSCAELVTQSYKDSFFQKRNVSISTARAGNVIGGGDFSADRIIPDCIRAIIKHEKIIVRNPYSIRPYQHVLEPLFAYLMIAERQYEYKEMASSYNIGPNDNDCISTGKLVEIFCSSWGNDCQWEVRGDQGPHEANFLKLDCSKLKKNYDWTPKWNIDTAVDKTVEWSKCFANHGDINKMIDNQIYDYLECEYQK